MKNFIIIGVVGLLLGIAFSTLDANKILKGAQIIIWDKDGDGTIDEVEAYWIVGTTDDTSLTRSIRRRYTQETKYINPSGDLKNIGSLTITQLITKIKDDVKGIEEIQ